MARTSKSPQAVTLAAMAVARRSLPEYAHRYSPKKFTQHQLFACLVLKNFLRTDYRGVAAHLADQSDVVGRLGDEAGAPLHDLSKGVPPLAANQAGPALAGRDGAAAPGPQAAGETHRHRLDRPGMQCGQRLLRPPPQTRGKPWKTVVYHRYPKLSVVSDIDDHFIYAYQDGRGPRPDVDEFRPLVADALSGFASRRWSPTPATIRKPIISSHATARHPHGHSRQARPADDQAGHRPLPAINANPLRPASLSPAIASRNRHVDDQTTPRSTRPRTNLSQPMPRPPLDGPHPQCHDSSD